MSVASSFIAIFASSGFFTLLPADHIDVENGKLRMGQVVDLSPLSDRIRSKVATKVIAEFPHSDRQIKVSSLSVERWARAAMPKMKFHSGEVRDFSVGFVGDARAGKMTDQQNQICFKTIAEISQHEIIEQGQLAATHCQRASTNFPVYFDRKNKLIRASSNLPSGTFLGRLRGHPSKVTDKGSELLFHAKAALVHITRKVEALQPAIAGKRVFVRSQDDKIFSTIYQSEGGTQ